MDSDASNRSIFVLGECQVTALLLRNTKETLLQLKTSRCTFLAREALAENVAYSARKGRYTI